MTQPDPLTQAATNVHIGKEGVFFLTGGAHSVLDLFRGERRAARASVAQLVANLQSRAEICASRGIATKTFVFPDKILALRDWLDLDPMPTMQSLFARDYAPNLGPASEDIAYLIDDVDSNRAAYLDLDTHQSPLGCRLHVARILQTVAPERRAAFDGAIAAIPQRTLAYRGDLSRKIDPALEGTVTRYLMNRSPARVATSAVKGGNDGLMILAENPTVSDGRLLIFGDSFFRQLVPYLALAFRLVMFCRTRYFHAEMIDAVAPDIVLCGMAERYLSRVFPDADRPHFLSYPLIKGRGVEADPAFAELWQRHVDSRRLAMPTPA